jgi:hypothetical protein
VLLIILIDETNANIDYCGGPSQLELWLPNGEYKVAVSGACVRKVDVSTGRQLLFKWLGEFMPQH